MSWDDAQAWLRETTGAGYRSAWDVDEWTSSCYRDCGIRRRHGGSWNVHSTTMLQSLITPTDVRVSRAGFRVARTLE